jgi:hypothetical protein
LPWHFQLAVAIFLVEAILANSSVRTPNNSDGLQNMNSQISKRSIEFKSTANQIESEDLFKKVNFDEIHLKEKVLIR